MHDMHIHCISFYYIIIIKHAKTHIFLKNNIQINEVTGVYILYSYEYYLYN